MPTAEDMRARFERRVSPPGPTDEKLVATLGLALLPTPDATPNVVTAQTAPAMTGPIAAPADPDGGGVAVEPADPQRPAGRRRPSLDVVISEPESADGEATFDGGGVGLDAVAGLFPAPAALAPTTPTPAVVKVGFPVPVALMREVTRFKVDLSRHLGRRLSNHEIGTAALRLLPTDPAEVAGLLRAHATRLGLTTDTPASPARRFVALVPTPAAAAVEDLTLALEEHLDTRVTKSQLWALAHVLLLERARSPRR